MEIRLIKGNILNHNTDALVHLDYVNVVKLSSLSKSIDRLVKGELTKRLINNEINTSFKRINKFLMEGTPSIKSFYSFHIIPQVGFGQFHLIDENLPYLMNYLVEDKVKSFCLTFVTFRTFDFKTAAHAYFDTILSLVISNPKITDEIDNIDFFTQDNNQIPFILAGIRSSLSRQHLKEYKEQIFQKDSERPSLLQTDPSYRLCARWIFTGGAVPPKIKVNQSDYDVFISYRRESGAETSRLIKVSLEKKFFKVFLDVDNLPSGHFDERLLQIIEDTQNFVVILSKGCLDNLQISDWLMREIRQALSTRRNIIPVMLRDFGFPNADSLPEDISTLHRHNGLSYSHEYFESFIEKLIHFLKR